MTIITPNWVKDAVFYQIFPDRFARSPQGPRPGNLQPWGAPPTPHGFQGGNLVGVQEKLDYLVDLGVNAIYFNPIFMSASNHRYHTFDYYQVDPLLGGNQAFKAMLAAAHQRGIRVILDGVFNHASRGFFPFNHILETGAESPYLDWFHIQKWPLSAYDGEKPANYAGWWNQRELPKFNTDTPAVREYLWQVATHWLAEGIDGWRLDVPNEIDDDQFWQTFRQRCKAVNPEAYIVGELWEEGDRWLQGDQFDAQMNYPFARLALGFLAAQTLDQTDIQRTGIGEVPLLDGPAFARGLHALHHQYHPEIVQAQMTMLSSHDTPRIFSVVQGDRTALRLLFLCQMTVAGAPNVYYGDEIGLPGRGDPDCRRAFPWDNTASWDLALRADVRRYITLRRALPALRRGDFSILLATRHLVVYRRQYGSQVAVVALNPGRKEAHFHLPAAALALPLDHLPDLLSKDGHPLQPDVTMSVPARSGRVWGNQS